MIKSLVTSGCSFSEHYNDGYATVRCWPGVFSEQFEFENFQSLGMGSCGNDIIARKAIYACSKALEKHPSEEILLIVMWSGLARKAFLTDNDTNILTSIKIKDVMNHPFQGSTLDNTVLGTNVPAWVWFNPGTSSEEAQRWYLHYDNDYQQLENTLWNMIAVQSFCAQHKIKYVWATMNNELYSMRKRLDRHVQDLHMNYLFDLLDLSNRIASIGMYEWTNANTTNGFIEDDFHPNVDSHRKFVSKVMLPFLESKNINLKAKDV